MRGEGRGAWEGVVGGWLVLARRSELVGIAMEDVMGRGRWGLLELNSMGKIGVDLEIGGPDLICRLGGGVWGRVGIGGGGDGEGEIGRVIKIVELAALVTKWLPK